MQQILNVLRNESWIIIVDIIVIIFWWFSFTYFDVMADWFALIGVSENVSMIIVMGSVLVIPLGLFGIAYLHEEIVDIEKKDEREKYHELKITQDGYFICITGMTAYLMLAPYHESMIWLWGVLVLTLLSRLHTRYGLSKEE